MILKFSILFFILFTNTFGKTVFSPNNEFPNELKLIYESIQDEIKTENQKRLQSYTLLMDQIPEYMEKGDIYFFIKTEIYKSILEVGIAEAFSLKSPDVNLLTKYQSIAQDKKGYTKFSSFIIDAIGRDLEVILSSPFYQSFLFKKVSISDIPEFEIKRIKKNFTILHYWYQLIRDYDTKDFNDLTNELGFNILLRITNNARLIPVLNGVEFKNIVSIKNLRYFSVNNIKVLVPIVTPSPMEELLSDPSLEGFIDENIVPDEAPIFESFESFIEENIVPEETPAAKVKGKSKKTEWKPKDEPVFKSTPEVTPTPEKKKSPMPAKPS